MPKLPECWESCGSCGHGTLLSVLEIPVAIGDTIARDDTILILETGKAALDIPSPSAGVIEKIWVTEGDALSEDTLLMTLL